MHIRKILITLEVLSLSLCGFAQETDLVSQVRSDLDAMFANIDRVNVPYGLLRDYAIDRIDWDSFDGAELSDSNFANFTIVCDAIQTLESANISGSQIPTFEQVSTSVQTCSDAVPIGVLAYSYSYIREDALDTGCITFVNGQVRNVYDEDVLRNPYSIGTIFTFSPRDNIIRTFSPVFRFDGFVHTNLPISRIEFDPGDGNGFRQIDIESDCSVSYSEEGEHELKLRLSLSDGVILISHSLLYILPPSPELMGNDEPFDDIYFFSCNTQYNNESPRASLSIKYAPGHISIEKPFIIVEGLDPLDFADLSNYPYGFTDISSIYGDLPNEVINEYDVLYVDWDNSNFHIQSNAELLITILDYINDNKVNPEESNIIFAQSMGGLIARYALCKMEHEGKHHSVSTFISDDVPYLGANVPLGALFAVQDVLHNFNILGLSSLTALQLLGIDSSKIQDIQNLLEAPSTRQMLTNWVNASGVIDNSYFEDFQSEINQMGFPRGDTGKEMALYAIANGAQDINVNANMILSLDASVPVNYVLGVIASCVVPIACMFTPLNIDMKFLSWLVFPGKNAFDLNLDILPWKTHGQKLYQMSLLFKKKFLWLINRAYSLYSNEKYAQATSVPLDLKGGSYYEIKTLGLEPLDTVVQYGNSINITASLDVADKFMFIPTASALCVGKGRRRLTTTDYNASYRNDSHFIDETPFLAVYTSDTSMRHIGMDNHIKEWLVTCLQAKIDGPSFVLNNEEYRVVGFIGNISWETSDPTIAQISPNGIISPLGSGTVTITATCSNNGSPIRICKTIWCGFPQCSLNATYKSFLPEFRVSILTEPTFSSFKDDADLLYRWGIKLGSGDISWEDTSVDYIEGVRGAYTTYVYFQFVKDNTVGTIYSVSIPHYFERRPDPIEPIELSPIYSSPRGTLTCGDLNLGEVPITKTSRNDIFVYSINDDINISADHSLSSAELCAELLKEEKFLKILSELKPWGEKSILLIPIDVFIQSSGCNQSGILTFVYNEKL